MLKELNKDSRTDERQLRRILAKSRDEPIAPVGPIAKPKKRVRLGALKGWMERRRHPFRHRKGFQSRRLIQLQSLGTFTTTSVICGRRDARWPHRQDACAT